MRRLTFPLSGPAVLACALVLTGCHPGGSIGGFDDAGQEGGRGGGGQPPPNPTERCGNGIDDTGDGHIDEGCPCMAGATQRCYRAGAATRNVGACHDGIQTCAVAPGASMGTWGDCTGDQGPAPELCGDDGNGDGTDQDCDHADDNGCGCCFGSACAVPRECPSGPTCVGGKKGTQTCGQDGKWSACVGAIPCPMPEPPPEAPEPATPEPPPDAPPDLAPDLAPDLPPDLAPDGPAACQNLSPPRLVAPLSTARVTKQRPTLHWELAPGTDGAHIEICRDRDCATPLTAFDATGTSGAPNVDLPAGVEYWRATGRSGGDVGCNPGQPWEMFVNRRSADVADTSWGTVLDVNMDGYADLLAGSSGAVFLYLGGPSGPALVPDATLTDPTWSGGGGLGLHVSDVGDTNGDGYADIGVFFADGLTKDLRIYAGGPSGISSTWVSLPVTTTINASVCAGGDLNGDGYADVATGGSSVGDPIQVFYGGPAGAATSPSVLLSDPMGGVNYSVAAAGDVNGDGIGDLIAGYPEAMHGAVWDFVGSAQIWYGSLTGPVLPGVNIPAAALPAGTFFDSPEFGYEVTGGGDVDGDGYADVLIAQNVARSDGGLLGYPAVWVYHGGAGGLASAPKTQIEPRQFIGKFSMAMTALDANGDGYWDVAVSDGVFDLAWVYHGSATGVSTVPVVMPTNGLDQGWFGASMTGADLNGDLFEDLVVGAYAAPQTGAGPGPGRAYVFSGGPMGVGAVSSKVVPAPTSIINFSGNWGGISASASGS